jgi:hypothetical protein
MTLFTELLTEVKDIVKYIPTWACELITETPATIAWLLGKDEEV